MPHEQEFACTKPRANLNMKPHPSIPLKRSRTGTLDTLTSLAPWSQLSPSSFDSAPAPKRMKTECTSVQLPEEQALPAAQEQVAPSNPAPVPTSDAHDNKALSSVDHQAPSVVANSSLSLSTAQSNGVSSAIPRNVTSHLEASLPLLPHQAGDEPHSSSNGSPDTSSAKMSAAHRLKLRDAIHFEFNLMILRKTEELRLIEQEQAKVQIALEQLRRCRQIPFPGQPGSSITHDQILDGTAPAVRPQPNHSRPSHAAAWGVTDGPYTKHYAKWLIPDPMFDAEPITAQQRQLLDGQLDGRLSGTDSGSAHRRQRHSTGGKIDTTHTDRPQATPKEKSATFPQILKRSDGQWVQLVCRECGQSLFRSVQGFMNHTRIQHEIRLKSHAQAANEWGRPVDGPHAPLQQDNVEPPTQPPPSSKLSTGHAHPLNATAPPSRKASHAKGSLSASSLSMDDLIQYSPVHPEYSRETPRDKNFDLLPSSNVPALSALASRLGNGADMQQLYAQASQKVDLESIEPLIPDSEVEDDVLVQGGSNWCKPPPQTNSNASPSLILRVPASSTRMQTKPPSIQVPSGQDPASRTLASFQEQSWSSPSFEVGNYGLSPSNSPSHQDFQMNELSPYGNPPGLVTDHEDDDEMEDEVQSVVEHPTTGHKDIRIFDDGNGDHVMTDISPEAKSPMHSWHVTQPPVPQPTPTTTANVAGDRRRRGRPSKKGKEKAAH